MSDAAAVVLAIATWLGARSAVPLPRGLAIVAVVAALALRRPVLLAAGAAALAASLGAAAWSGLVPPARPVAIAASGVLTSDPETVAGSVRAEVRFGEQRVDAWARGSAAVALRTRDAGDVVALVGRLRAPPDAARHRLAVRHVAARLDVERVDGWRTGSPAARAANAVRDLLDRGAASLAPARRALLRGLLVGDDRDIPAVVEADFRAAGLTHLLAVSGQQVVLVVAMVEPLLRRLGLRARLVGTLAVIGFFAVVTRGEPSVLRASAMAAIACWAGVAGRPVTRLRVLALAVTALVLVDPLLVHSTGFQLSVGASVGLVVLARPLERRIPGPRWLAGMLGVTLAAQAGVAPVLVGAFGGMPVVTVLANLLAVPAAAPLTTWGLTAGLVAGALGGPVATVVQVPSAALVWWIAGVARLAASLPFGDLDGRGVVAVAIACLAFVRWRRAAAALVVATVLVVSRPATGHVAGRELALGARLWRAGGATVLVLDPQADAGRVLVGLHHAGVRSVDLVVARSGGRQVGGTVFDLRSRVGLDAIVAPVGHRIRDATEVTTPVSVRVGALVVALRPRGAVLDVDIGETAGGGGAAR
jgi:competence protein ComEC